MKMKYRKKKGIVEETIQDAIHTVFTSLEDAFESVGDSFKYLENIMPPEINFDLHKMPHPPFSKQHRSRKEENTFILDMIKEDRLGIDDAEVLLKAVNSVYADKEDIMMILEMYKEGKISLEEAEKLIKAVGD